MNLEIVSLALFAGGLAALFGWGFRTLPAERWQFLACTATERGPGGEWTGVNFTYYGFFSALAYSSAAALFLALTASVGVPPAAGFVTLALLVAVCLPASTWIVRIVERKRYGFTVGGASFVGFLAAPFVTAAVGVVSQRYWGKSIPVLPTLAAMAIAYALGEAVGRLACISFGCCYGKPVGEIRGWARRVASRFPFVFLGDTKKAAFASRLAGTPVVPVQAMTSVALGAVAWLGTVLFLAGGYRPAFAFAVASLSQLWRIYSETLRADYLGEGRISAYQIMAGLAAGLALTFAIWAPALDSPPPDLAAGFAALASPGAILLLQALFALIFWKMGRSAQTGSKISFHVHPDRI